MERKITLTKKTAKLIDLLKKREGLNNEAIAHREKLEDMERAGMKILTAIQKIKDKVSPLVVDELKPQLSEFEVVASVKLENDVPVATIINVLEEYKETYRKQQQANTKK